MQGATPLASPGLNPGGTGFSCGKRCPEGGAGGWLPANLALPEPGGGLAFLVARLPFALALFLPPSPRPPSRREGGESKFISPGATAPGTPATGWEAALAQLSASVHFTVKAKDSVYLWAVPAAKERGDRGRWNYPSQATAAFEMVSPPGRGEPMPHRFKRIQNPQQKRLSRFCKTQNPSRHPTQQGNHRSGRQRKSSAK